MPKVGPFREGSQHNLILRALGSAGALNDPAVAERMIRQAIELSPEQSNLFGTQGGIEYEQSDDLPSFCGGFT